MGFGPVLCLLWGGPGKCLGVSELKGYGGYSIDKDFQTRYSWLPSSGNQNKIKLRSY